MGFGVGNIYIMPHSQDGSFVDFTVRVHQGNQSLDTTSPALSQNNYGALKAAADDASDFGDAVAAIGGAFQSWFMGLTSAQREGVRKGFPLL
jgi:hypothetical protein